MAIGRLKQLPGRAKPLEWAARLLLLFLLIGLPLAIVAARPGSDVITLHASMPESGGWQPGNLSAQVGQPLHLRLTSDDVVHGFAVGVGPDGHKHGSPEVEVKPGQVTQLTLTFDRPGSYTYTCTRWCGPNHWRMRGTIEVSSSEGLRALPPADPPLYVTLGLDIDAPHPAPVVPAGVPSASRGARLALEYPAGQPAEESYTSHSPAEVWLAWRDLPELAHLDDAALWDAVAAFWRQHTTSERLALGQALYSQNCAACHGESGAGDGVFARAETAGPVAPGHSTAMRGGALEPATDFTDPALLGASNALLEGKLLRGGMGTGMPAWGTVLSDDELQALLDYLWTFQFPQEAP